MSSISPILSSVVQTAYANQNNQGVARSEEKTERVADRDNLQPQPKTSAAGNTTVTLSEAALQLSQQEANLRVDESVKPRESVEQGAGNNTNETLAGLSYGSQVKS